MTTGIDPIAFSMFVAPPWQDDLLPGLGIDEAKLKNWISVIRFLYKPNPYHNAYHGLDVMEMCYKYLAHYRLADVFTLSDVLATLMASFGHDVMHPGVNQVYYTYQYYEILLY